MRFYRSMLRMTWTAHVSSDQTLEKMEIKRTFILNIRKSQLKFLLKGDLEIVIFTGQFEGKRDSGKQRMTCRVSLSIWMAVQG